MIDTAHYYSRTGRRQLADSIYTNLLNSRFFALGPKNIQGTVFFAYSDYLKEQGDSAKAASVQRQGRNIEEELNGKGPSIYRYDGHEKIPCDTDWQSAAEAYKAVVSEKYAEARTMVDALLLSERKQSKHMQSHLGRLIHLARAYAAKKRTAEAQDLLERILPLTEADELANTRLYVSAELFLLPGNQTGRTNKYWELLYKSVGHVDDVISSISLSPPATETERQERIVHYMDILAQAYAYNGEGEKAYRLLETALTSHSPSANYAAWVDADRSYFAACAGKYSAITPDIEKSLNDQETIQNPYVDILAKIMDVCIRQGKLDVGEAFAQHVIDVRTKKKQALWSRPQPNESALTPQQVAENHKFEIEAELSAVRYKLGEIYLAEGRYAQAEAVLQCVQATGTEIVDQQNSQVKIYLGRALIGQHKYDEALELFKQQTTNGQDSGVPFAWEIVKLIELKPQFSADLQTKVIEVFMSAGGARMGKGMMEPTEKLLALSKAQNWTESNIDAVKNLLNDYQKCEGY
ncbi:MAG: tetratricopeptide repeat protein [Cyanobacteria bacterium SZAS LIN-3]|nr:tetratricopeptide repeat protein [Cyanobacteria bacterium SZAS LIN-3]